MKVLDCPWELNDIGKKTVQLNYTNEDIYSSEEVGEAVKNSQYLVAKVPCGNVDCLMGLQDDGFEVLETQIKLFKDLMSFVVDAKAFDNIFEDVSFCKVNGDSDFANMTNYIDENMFTTDRITLDKHFGPVVGRKRYVGWMKNEYVAKTSSFWWINKERQPIGFMMLR